MTDLAQLPTDMLPDLPASEPDPQDEQDTFNLSIHAAFKEFHQLRKLNEAQRLEIERLREELRLLRAGQGVEVVIDGQRFAVAVSPSSNGHKSEYTDSFML